MVKQKRLFCPGTRKTPVRQFIRYIRGKKVVSSDMRITNYSFSFVSPKTYPFFYRFFRVAEKFAVYYFICLFEINVMKV